MIFSPFDTPPDAVNDIGTKFWLDQTLTTYATTKRTPGVSGYPLPDTVRVFFVEAADGYRTRLLCDGGDVLYEATNLESMAVHIDILRLAAKPQPRRRTSPRGSKRATHGTTT